LPGQSLLSLVWLCLRTNVFITLHNALPPVPKWRWAIWKLKFGVISHFNNFHVYCTNKHAAAYFSRLFSKRVADDIKITYDSIDPVEIDTARDAAFDRIEILERLGISTNKFLVLAVGQFIDRKGRWIFLEAAKKVVLQNSDVIFVWVSPFLPSGDDAKRVESFGLGDSSYLVRSDEIGTTRQDILRFFRVADIFVLPSYVEGVPIALLEAMAMGVPSISTNVYGIPEAVIHEKTGLLIEAGDSEGLAASVSRLVSDKELRTSLARQGREHAVQNFDERIAASTAVKGYNEVLAAGSDKSTFVANA
jgi:glycosyltransferase involved in cell wall biosynthesis